MPAQRNAFRRPDARQQSQHSTWIVECNSALNIAAGIQNANLTRPKARAGFGIRRWPDVSPGTQAQCPELQKPFTPIGASDFNDCHCGAGQFASSAGVKGLA